MSRTNFGEKMNNYRPVALKGCFLALMLLCLYPALPFGLLSLTTILVVILAILGTGKNEFLDRWASNSRAVQLNVLFFILLIATLAYSENFQLGMIQLQRALPLALFPLIFLLCAFTIDTKKFQILMGCFVLGNGIFLVYVFNYLVTGASDYIVPAKPGQVLFQGLAEMGLTDQLKMLWQATFHEVHYYAQRVKPEFLFIHKTYASQSLLLCIFMLIYLVIRRPLFNLGSFGLLLLIALYTIALIYLYSLINLLILIGVAPLLIFFLLKSKKQRRNWIIIVILGGILLGFLSINQKRAAEESYARFLEYEHPAFIFQNLNRMIQNDSRNAINQCNWQVYSSSPIFGIGIGDIQDELNSCFDRSEDETIALVLASDEPINTHNTYAFLLLAGGIFVLLPFVMMLCYNGYIALKGSDILYISFLLIAGINMLVETTFVRAQGITFFALWNALFLARSLRN